MIRNVPDSGLSPGLEDIGAVRGMIRAGVAAAIGAALMGLALLSAFGGLP